MINDEIGVLFSEPNSHRCEGDSEGDIDFASCVALRNLSRGFSRGFRVGSRGFSRVLGGF